MELLNILTVLLIFKKLNKFPNISVNFVYKKLADHILEIPRPVVFGVKCFYCETSTICLRNNLTWNKDDIEVVI